VPFDHSFRALLESSVVDRAPSTLPPTGRRGEPLAPPVRTRVSANGVGREPLHVLQVFQPDIGGVPRYAAALAQGLVANGWRVSVACPPNAWVCDNLRSAGIEILPMHAARGPRPWQDARAIRKLVRWCREREISLIHGHSTKAGLLVAMAGRITGVPSIYTPHGWAFEMEVPPPLRLTYALAERQFARRCHAAVMTVSAFERGDAERWRVTPRGQIQVVRTGLPEMPHIDKAAARRALGVDEEGTVAAWVGRTGPQKRAGDLAAIARALGEEVTVVALCDGIHGTPLAGELAEAGVVVADPGCGPATVYAAADIMLHTSQWEACPLVVLEAMAAGLPVVAYSVGGVPEQVQAGRTGHLVERGDVEMLCQCVLALARNPDVRRRMGEAGHQRATRVFNYGAMLERIMQAYMVVVGPHAIDAGSRGEASPHDAFDGLMSSALGNGSANRNGSPRGNGNGSLALNGER
jgi:glycosyltransferase involved in cell wall biosynthesis